LPDRGTEGEERDHLAPCRRQAGAVQTASTWVSGRRQPRRWWSARCKVFWRAASQKSQLREHRNCVARGAAAYAAWRALVMGRQVVTDWRSESGPPRTAAAARRTE